MKTGSFLIALTSIVVPVLAGAGNVTFRAEPSTILAGDRSVLCYEGTPPRTATFLPEHTYMEPGPKPSCVKVRPLTTTTYSISGRDAQGARYDSSVTIVVKPATHIIWFYGDAPVISPGETLLVCYGVDKASSVKLIQPRVEALPLSANRCISEHPKRTTRYTLKASGSDGRTVQETFLVRVK